MRMPCLITRLASFRISSILDRTPDKSSELTAPTIHGCFKICTHTRPHATRHERTHVRRYSRNHHKQKDLSFRKKKHPYIRDGSHKYVCCCWVASAGGVLQRGPSNTIHSVQAPGDPQGLGYLGTWVPYLISRDAFTWVHDQHSSDEVLCTAPVKNNTCTLHHHPAMGRPGWTA